jgi:hypothetical protein
MKGPSVMNTYVLLIFVFFFIGTQNLLSSYRIRKLVSQFKIMNNFNVFNSSMVLMNQTLEVQSSFTTETNGSVILPLVCIITTFKPTQDPLKMMAYQNSAFIYFSMNDVVKAFLATTPSSLSYEIPLWLKAGHAPETILSNIETNSFGTPYLISLLQKVDSKCPSNIFFVGYVNGDIIFEHIGLLTTLKFIKQWFKYHNDKEINHRHLMMVGQRSNHILRNILELKNLSTVESTLFQTNAQDYFIFSRPLPHLEILPKFVIGRRAYDNALVDWACHHATLVDVTATLTAIHQTTSDGNFAGHSENNLDKEFNVHLPDVMYDHGSTTDAHFYTTTSTLDGSIVIKTSSGVTTSCYCTSEYCEEDSEIYCGNYVPVFPLNLVEIMQKSCWSPQCELIAREHQNPVMIGNSLVNIGVEQEKYVRREIWKNKDVLDLSNAFIDTEGDVCFKDQHIYTIIGSYGCRDNAILTRCTSATFQTEGAYDKVVVISQLWGDGYFHAIIEGLPRIIPYINYINERNDSLNQWVVHSMLMDPLAQEIATFLGVKRFVNGPIHAHRLLLSTSTPCGGSLIGKHTRELRHLIRSLILVGKDLPNPHPTFILVKRNGVRRSLLNHENVLLKIRQLWKLGPVIEHSGDGTFLQQMSLFASAMIIMGPHGAGLSNAIAMSEGSIMIEIIPEVGSNAFNMCYMALAYNLNLKYFALRAPHFDSEGTATLPLHYLSSLPFFESHTP